jgi:hypothetical protein
MTKYIPAKPMRVKSTLPEETRGETPSEVRNSP